MTYVGWPPQFVQPVVKIVQRDLDDRKQLSGNHFLARPSHDGSNLFTHLPGFRPARGHPHRQRRALRVRARTLRIEQTGRVVASAFDSNALRPGTQSRTAAMSACISLSRPTPRDRRHPTCCTTRCATPSCIASWPMMRGASLRSVAELLGHQPMKMTMRYAHLSPAFLSAEVSLLDPRRHCHRRRQRARRKRKDKKRAKRPRERFCGDRSARFC
jgi:hypothetical protein